MTLVQEFRGVKEIANIHHPAKRQHIVKVMDADGSLQSSKDSITEVVASYYMNLYTNSTSITEASPTASAIALFTQHELKSALA